jgi:dCMP deaminase
VGEGFNGFPRFMSDDPALYADREWKYSRTLHAELNAVLFAKQTEGCTAYVTHPPCAACSLILIQSGVSRVVAVRPSEDLMSRWEDSFSKTKGFFDEADVTYELVEYDDGRETEQNN